MSEESSGPKGAAKTSSPFDSTEEDREAARSSTRSDPEQQRLKNQAQWIRSKLARTLEVLKRRHDELTSGAPITKHPVPFALAGIGTLLVLLIGRLWGRRSHQHMIEREAQAIRARALLEGRSLPRPDAHQLAILPHRSLLGEVMRSLVINVATFVLSEVARYGVTKLMHKSGEPKT